MSKYFGKCFGPSTPAPKSSFWLRCPSFLLSKFASQLNLIQFVYGSGYLESESKVQFSGSCSQDSESQGRNFQGPGTYFQVLGCQGPRVPGSRVPESRVSGSWFKGLRVRGPGSHVLTLDYAFPVPGCQGPRGPGSRVPKSRVSGSQGPGSQS